MASEDGIYIYYDEVIDHGSGILGKSVVFPFPADSESERSERVECQSLTGDRLNRFIKESSC